MLKLKKTLITLTFSLLLLSACSKEVMEEISRTVNSNFGGYTEQNPLVIYPMPFKPADKFDSSSEIGKLAFKGVVSGILDMAFFSDGKIKCTGWQQNNKSCRYGNDDTSYYNVLRNDGFWQEVASQKSDIKQVLENAASRKNANAIVYGLYDGDDSHLRLSVYLYSKTDDIILKERTEINVPFMQLKNLVTALDNGRSLDSGQKALQQMVHEKAKLSTVRLIRKYTEGR